MKKILLATSAMVLVSTSLTGAYCSSCARGPHAHHASHRAYNAQGRHQNLNTMRNSRSPLGKTDHYLTENDRQILQQVRQQFQNNDVAADNVAVIVEYGKVVLDGSVPSTGAKESLQQHASNVEGVRHVIMDVYVDERNGQNRQDQQQQRS